MTYETIPDYARACRIEQIVPRDYLDDIDCTGLVLDELQQDFDRSDAVIAKVVAMRLLAAKTAHDFLTNEGAYVHIHVGPDHWGHDEYDIYEGDSHVIIMRRSHFLEMALIDWECKGLRRFRRSATLPAHWFDVW